MSIIQESEIEFKIIDGKFIAITQLKPRRGQIVLLLENVPGFVGMMEAYISHHVKKQAQIPRQSHLKT
jgi:hypothetical protein